MRKRMAKFLSLFLTAVMVCSLLSVSALAALESHEQQTCKFQILYVDSSFGAGYSYGISWDEPYTCQYSEGHSGYNHSIACSKIREQVETAKAKVDSGWEIVGWAKEAKPSPTVLTTYTGTTATQTTYTIYLVAKRPASAEVTYTLTYNANGGSGAPAAQTAKSSTGSATFTISTSVPTWDDHTFLGWADSADAAAAAYHGGGTITVSADKTIYAVWKQNHHHNDTDDDGFCDDDNECMHVKDTEGYCTVSGCKHPSSCCPKRSSGPAGPTESQLQDILGTDFVTVTCETLPDEHHDGTYGLLTGGYTLGAVQGDDASGYTVNLTLKLTNYVEAFGTDTRKVHTPAEGETDRSVTLQYNKESQLWALAAGVTGVTFKAVCNDKSSQPGMVKLADGQTSIGERKPSDTMVFTLNSTVPSDLLRMNTAGVMELVNPYTLVFHDKMNEKLESDYSDLEVTIGSMVLDPATDYTVATAGLSGGETLNVTLDLAALYNAGKITKDDLGKTPIVVSYTAKVVDDAINGDLLRNDAYVRSLEGSSSISTVIGTVVDTPHTGGPGTMIFTVAGMALLGGAAGLMVLRRRKEDAEN